MGWVSGGGSQAGWGSGLELEFFLGAQPMKPAGLDSDAFRVNSDQSPPELHCARLHRLASVVGDFWEGFCLVPPPGEGRANFFFFF